MLHITIYPACLHCNYTDATTRCSISSSYWECQHKCICKLIEGQTPLIDTYDITQDEAESKYGKGFDLNGRCNGIE